MSLVSAETSNYDSISGLATQWRRVRQLYEGQTFYSSVCMYWTCIGHILTNASEDSRLHGNKVQRWVWFKAAANWYTPAKSCMFQSAKFYKCVHTLNMYYWNHDAAERPRDSLWQYVAYDECTAHHHWDWPVLRWMMLADQILVAVVRGIFTPRTILISCWSTIHQGIARRLCSLLPPCHLQSSNKTSAC